MHRYLAALLIIALGAGTAAAQTFSFEALVGTWEGRITSETFGGHDDPITLVVEPDGYYTDSSGHLMPTIYPDTQRCEFDEPSNRVHFWYLQTVYAGQYFYQHFYYEVVEYTGGYLELHYNFWDDPDPLPHVGTIALNRVGSTSADEIASAASSLAAYPNPFNPRTTLAFELPEAGEVRLDIFDASGRKVESLARERLPAGRHELAWEAGDAASGLYLAVLEAGGRRELRRLTLLK